MPNIKSSKKHMTQSEKKRKKNISRRSMMKTFIKKVFYFININNKKTAKNVFCKMQTVLDRLASKKLIHKNKAARHKSKLITKINNMK